MQWKRGGPVTDGARILPEETAVAIVHDASTTAVMMATPADIEDFALGFSLSEGVIDRIEDVLSIEIVEGELGVEARVWLAPGLGQRLAGRRRRLAGPTGCGLCGIDSLAEALRTPRAVRAGRFSVQAEDLLEAMAQLSAAQTLGQTTRAVHAAGLWSQDQGLIAVREDVGRHNALDKLIGAQAHSAPALDGVALLTSRVSVEMIQKAAVLGVRVVCAVSAPTALALRTANEAGITLVAVARSDGFEVFTHPERILIP